MARPKKADTERRTEQQKIRYRLDEIEAVRASAARSGLTVAEFIRRRSLHEETPSLSRSVDPALIHALGRVGNNVNQLARSVHRGSDFQVYWHEIGEELRTVLAAALDEFDA
jgi:hypothetical protein